ncbi:hypothetical protein [uncultured Bacteroides sp.]|uniref:hypothetical protein n=1 Tax=uncultured Bacteroides sp. TaxID=162156 RepID=UPI0025955E6F|nr:hypothetical protein [uncultured Bacteroides sp.]
MLTNATSNVGEPNKHSTGAKQAICESRTSIPEAADMHFSPPKDTIFDYYLHIYAIQGQFSSGSTSISKVSEKDCVSQYGLILSF